MTKRNGTEDFHSSKLLPQFLSSQTVSTGSCTAYFDPSSSDLSIRLQKMGKDKSYVRLKPYMIVPYLGSPNLQEFSMTLSDRDSALGVRWNDSEEFSFNVADSKNILMKTTNSLPQLIRLDIQQIGEIEELDNEKVNVLDFKPNSLRYFKILIGRIH